jgi:hypothetical protein
MLMFRPATPVTTEVVVAVAAEANEVRLQEIRFVGPIEFSARAGAALASQERRNSAAQSFRMGYLNLYHLEPEALYWNSTDETAFRVWAL